MAVRAAGDVDVEFSFSFDRFGVHVSCLGIYSWSGRIVPSISRVEHNAIIDGPGLNRRIERACWD